MDVIEVEGVRLRVVVAADVADVVCARASAPAAELDVVEGEGVRLRVVVAASLCQTILAALVGLPVLSSGDQEHEPRKTVHRDSDPILRAPFVDQKRGPQMRGMF